jgi:regulator of sigma E protease
MSVSLAFINIMPFPALDGGRVLFVLIEKLKGSPVSPKIESAMHKWGFLLLLLLLVLVTIKDVAR